MSDENSVWKRRSACVDDVHDEKQSSGHEESSLFCHPGYLSGLKRCKLEMPEGTLSKCLPNYGSLSERKKYFTLSRRNLFRRTSSRLSPLDGSLRRKSIGSWRSGTISRSLKWKRRSSVVKHLQNYSELLLQSGKLNKGSRNDTLKCNFGDSDGQERIDYEETMRLASTKLMLASKSSKQTVEAARNILLSTARIENYRISLIDNIQQNISESVSACRGSVTLSDIRLPLMWKNHFSNKTDKDSRSSYSVFCMVILGDEVQATQLMADVDRLQTDVCFPDVLTFNGVSGDFTATLEVYSHRQLDADLPSANALTGWKVRQGNIENTENKIFGPKFSRIASSVWTLSDTTGLIQSLPIHVDSTGGKSNGSDFNVLPLFGCYCCSIRAVPDFFRNTLEPEISGWMSVQTTSEKECKEYWAVMKPTEIRYWSGPDDAASATCLLSISLKGLVSIASTTSEEGLVVTLGSNDDNIAIDYTLSFVNSSELKKWHAVILQRLRDLEVWPDSAHGTDIIPGTPASSLVSKYRINSGRNLCHSDATGDGASPMTRVLRRLNIETMSNSHKPITVTQSDSTSTHSNSTLFQNMMSTSETGGDLDIDKCKSKTISRRYGVTNDGCVNTCSGRRKISPTLRAFKESADNSSNMTSLIRNNSEAREELSVKFINESSV